MNSVIYAEVNTTSKTIESRGIMLSALVRYNWRSNAMATESVRHQGGGGGAVLQQIGSNFIFSLTLPLNVTVTL